MAQPGPKNQQEIAAEITSAQRPQIIEWQAGKAHPQSARAEREVQRGPEAHHQEEAMDEVEHAICEFVAGPSPAHQAALADLGPCPLHRLSWRLGEGEEDIDGWRATMTASKDRSSA